MEENRIASHIKQLTTENGFVETILPGVRTFIAYGYEPRKSFSYDPCLIIVGQGRKIVYLEDKEFNYDEENYLVLPTVLPLECETFATKQQPLVNLIIDIDIALLKQVIERIKLEDRIAETGQIIHTAKITETMEDAIVRLLKVLQNKQETDILAKDILKEIYYRALKDSPASALYTFAEQQSMVAKIAQTLNYINANLERTIEITELADMNNMSVSAFHKHFKQVTGNAPLQCIKKTRLTKAKTLIELQGIKAKIVANMVGYESYSQFSREYKRMFGFSPRDTV
tara:strand:+ start:4898 stop:5752 length:855 start_codon:yes stop_codon:yes gene_type:complete